MATRRLVFAILFALTISATFTAWISRKLAAMHADAKSISYVATTRSLEAGNVLQTSDLEYLAWPASKPLDGAFTDLRSAVGRALLYPLAAHDPLLERQLAPVGSGVGLTTKIPSGMRAVSLKTDQVVGVAGFLLPGTHVDVLVTFHTATSADPITATVLQDKQVIAAGQKMQPDPDGKASPVDVVTILVSPQEAEKVVLANAQGSVRFVLRNGSDHTQMTNAPMQLSALGEITNNKPSALPTPPPKPKEIVASVAPKRYSIEVIRGDKQSLETF